MAVCPVTEWLAEHVTSAARVEANLAHWTALQASGVNELAQTYGGKSHEGKTDKKREKTIARRVYQHATTTGDQRLYADLILQMAEELGGTVHWSVRKTVSAALSLSAFCALGPAHLLSGWGEWPLICADVLCCAVIVQLREVQLALWRGESAPA